MTRLGTVALALVACAAPLAPANAALAADVTPTSTADPAPTSTADPAPSDSATAAPTAAPAETTTTAAPSPGTVSLAGASLGIRTVDLSGSTAALTGVALGLPDGAGIAVYRASGNGPWTRQVVVPVRQGGWSASVTGLPAGPHRFVVVSDGTALGTGLPATTDAVTQLGLVSSAVTRTLDRGALRTATTPVPPPAPKPPVTPPPPLTPPPTVTITAPASVLATATTQTVAGVASPGTASVRLQRLVGSTWTDAATVRPAANGSFSWSSGLGVNTLASLTVRAVATDARGVTGTSAPVTIARVLPADQVRLTDAQARGIVTWLGVPVKSSGGCANRHVSSCTSLDTMTTGVVRQIATLKRASSCAMTITGGTETGHATGTYSHFNGYKVDLAMSSCLTAYIRAHATPIGGSKWYRTPTTYFNEVSHWDLTVKS